MRLAAAMPVKPAPITTQSARWSLLNVGYCFHWPAILIQPQVSFIDMALAFYSICDGDYYNFSLAFVMKSNCYRLTDYSN